MNGNDSLILLRISIAIGIGIALLILSFFMSSRISQRSANFFLLLGYLIVIGGFIYFLFFFGDNVLQYGTKIIQRLSP